ncbi:MAG: hypothetical protein ABSF71_08635 [Terriglobia bacterium]
MSLVHKPEMTEKKVTANLRNQQLCHGPVTDEGRERIRAANLRHGFYAEAEEVAMRALGEDPIHYQELVEGLWATYNPTDTAQEGLVIRLARATWLQNRADRMQEGYAVRQAQDVNLGRKDRLHAQMMRLKITADSLRLLVQSVARRYYITTREDHEKMKSLHQEGVVKEMGEIALALFCRLERDEDQDGPEDYERAKLIVAQVKSIFGIGMTDYNNQTNAALEGGQPGESPQEAVAAEAEEQGAPSCFTPAEWEARERARHLLENILRRQVEICEEQRKAILKESVKGPSPYERAAEIAPTHPNARLMRRMQDSNFREIRRVTNLLLKLKRHQRKMEALGQDDERGHEISVEGV